MLASTLNSRVRGRYCFSRPSTTRRPERSLRQAERGVSRVALPFTNTGGNLKAHVGSLVFQSTTTQSSGNTTVYNNATLAVFGTYVVSGGNLYGAAGTS